MTSPSLWLEVGEASPTDPASFALAVKANIAVRGFRRSAGCRVLDVAPEHIDAPVVAAFRRHGAIVTGTTNMHELALGVTSDNATYGPVPVPSATHLSAGGSSGGSAAVVSAGLARFALGTDTGGSVSIPAAHCAVVGFRPSTDRWPTARIVGLSWTRDTPGIFARTVDEAIRADGWVTGARSATVPDRLRLGIARAFVGDLDPRTAAAMDRVITTLEAHADLVEIDLGPVLDLTRRAEWPLVEFEAPRELGLAAADTLGLPPADALAALRGGAASPDVAGFLDAVHRHPVLPDAYARAVQNALTARARADEMFEAHGIHALVFPTTPSPAPPIDGGTNITHNGREQSAFELYTRHTGLGTVLGAPMVTVPMGEAEAIGLTVQGRRGDDARTLAAARVVAEWIAG